MSALLFNVNVSIEHFRCRSPQKTQLTFNVQNIYVWLTILQTVQRKLYIVKFSNHGFMF